MFSISSIGKLQKITKIFTLFYNPYFSDVKIEIISPFFVIQRLVWTFILLHFDIFVNLSLFKISLYFSFCNKNKVAFL